MTINDLSLRDDLEIITDPVELQAMADQNGFDDPGFTYDAAFVKRSSPGSLHILDEAYGYKGTPESTKEVIQLL